MIAAESWPEAAANAASDWERLEMTPMPAAYSNGVDHRVSLVACSFDSVWSRLAALPLVEARVRGEIYI